MPRAELYARCDSRFLAMLDAGALEEAKALHALRLSADLPAMRAVGVPEGHLRTVEMGGAVSEAGQ